MPNNIKMFFQFPASEQMCPLQLDQLRHGRQLHLRRHPGLCPESGPGLPGEPERAHHDGLHRPRPLRADDRGLQVGFLNFDTNTTL